MELWLDTTDLELISSAKEQGWLHGVTTNPSIIAKSKNTFEETLRILLDVQPGPVTAQVIAKDTKGMLEQADKLHSFSKRIIIKIPATPEGFAATSELAKRNIFTMVTVVFDPTQVLLAASVGATYVAPYLGRIEKIGNDPVAVLRSMQSIIEKNNWNTKLIAASIKSKEIISACAEIGIGAITLPAEMVVELRSHSETTKSISAFEKDWENMTTPDIFS